MGFSLSNALAGAGQAIVEIYDGKIKQQAAALAAEKANEELRAREARAEEALIRSEGRANDTWLQHEQLRNDRADAVEKQKDAKAKQEKLDKGKRDAEAREYVRSKGVKLGTPEGLAALAEYSRSKGDLDMAELYESQLEKAQRLNLDQARFEHTVENDNKQYNLSLKELAQRAADRRDARATAGSAKEEAVTLKQIQDIDKYVDNTSKMFTTREMGEDGKVAEVEDSRITAVLKKYAAAGVDNNFAPSAIKSATAKSARNIQLLLERKGGRLSLSEIEDAVDEGYGVSRKKPAPADVTPAPAPVEKKKPASTAEPAAKKGFLNGVSGLDVFRQF